METFIFNDNKIGFKNIDRRPEEDILKEVMDLMKTKGVKIGKCQKAPYVDIYPCKHGNIEFDLLFDLDDGVEIYCGENVQTVQKLFN